LKLGRSIFRTAADVLKLGRSLFREDAAQRDGADGVFVMLRETLSHIG
jgi:hypothetical protein